MMRLSGCIPQWMLAFSPILHIMILTNIARKAVQWRCIASNGHRWTVKTAKLKNKAKPFKQKTAELKPCCFFDIQKNQITCSNPVQNDGFPHLHIQTCCYMLFSMITSMACLTAIKCICFQTMAFGMHCKTHC